MNDVERERRLEFKRCAAGGVEPGPEGGGGEGETEAEPPFALSYANLRAKTREKGWAKKMKNHVGIPVEERIKRWCGLVCCSGAKGTSATVAAVAARFAGAVRPDERGRRGVRQPQRPLVPLLVHKPAPQGGAVPDLALRPVHAAQQHHGDRQHMRAGREAPLLGGRVGEEHPVLPRPPGHRPGSPPQASVERAVRAEREPVLDAAPRGAPPGRGRPPRVPDGRGPRRRLHGPHQDLSGASGEAQGPPRRLRRVQLPQGHRPLHHRSDLILFPYSFS